MPYKDREKRREYHRRYGTEHRENFRKYWHKFYWAHREQEAERKRQYWRSGEDAHARNAEYQLVRLYGIGLSEYNAMLASQGGVCKTCGARGTRRLCVDHDHKTGKVRGLLCRSCNFALGLLQDNPDRLRALLTYLGE